MKEKDNHEGLELEKSFIARIWPLSSCGMWSRSEEFLREDDEVNEGGLNIYMPGWRCTDIEAVRGFS